MYIPKIDKFFNTAGPAQIDIHYTLDPLRRINYEEISRLIVKRSYFVLHAPRQTGKTTSLLAMVRRINAEGVYRCVYINVESAQVARNDVEKGMRAVLSELGQKLKLFLDEPEPYEWVSSILEVDGELKALSTMLTRVCEKLEKPLVLFIDEIDALVGDTLVSILRQLRDAYATRPKFAPISVILCGVRDIRDYRIHRSDGEIITGGSCFNIKTKSLRLGNFSESDILELYHQHTEATGQIFEENAYTKVWELTRGQPWLVNALANQVTSEMPEGRDRSNPITLDMIEEAANQIIISRATHLDQLTDKLREPRVRRVIAPIAAGENWQDTSENAPHADDIEYVIDLGLLRREGAELGRALVISNEIYKEIIPRELTSVMQDNMSAEPAQLWYVNGDGTMDMSKLLREFQQFFRENSESWLERFDYKEAGFQLLLQAFLQRIVNGGGYIDREYALGRGRVDLLVRWRYPGNAASGEQKEQRIVLELKTIRDRTLNTARTLSMGIDQTARYAERSNAMEAHLIICDERMGQSWDNKIYERTERIGNFELRVWGC
ncbi:MAG: ATP-binding protein [Synergistaceae bacterium]|nr:ATP-binding protein [Synergistaceae bacterium]